MATQLSIYWLSGSDVIYSMFGFLKKKLEISHLIKLY